MAKINTIITKEGDTAAGITAAFYGSSKYIVDVLAANPDLNLYPLLLPAGLKNCNACRRHCRSCCYQNNKPMGLKKTSCNPIKPPLPSTPP